MTGQSHGGEHHVRAVVLRLIVIFKIDAVEFRRVDLDVGAHFTKVESFFLIVAPFLAPWKVILCIVVKWLKGGQPSIKRTDVVSNDVNRATVPMLR